ncbi:hypothetical protein [Microvirga flavescens]|uniref:hypothetical protein n=1 Tax=Microvirga flavescens TaxID=2249811 RepID=UPI000DD72DA8|nr:hypothetical protein [Microvirga flavescens]
MKITTAFAFSCLTAFGAHAAAADAPRNWFRDQGYVAPLNGRIIACHGYGCARRTEIGVDSDWFTHVAGIMRAGRTSAQAERLALRDAVRIYTAHLAAQFGGPPDAPRSPPSLSGQVGQMDCLDEAANTTSLLLLLQERGLLAYHEVARPQSRGFFIDGRYPHFTAVIVQKEGHSQWAVDPWTSAPGSRPDLLPLEDWQKAS